MIETRERGPIKAPDRTPDGPEAAPAGPERSAAPVRLDRTGVGTPANLLRLQQMAGNAAVSRLVSTLRPPPARSEEQEREPAPDEVGSDGAAGATGGEMASAVAAADDGAPPGEGTGDPGASAGSAAGRADAGAVAVAAGDAGSTAGSLESVAGEAGMAAGDAGAGGALEQAPGDAGPIAGGAEPAGAGIEDAGGELGEAEVAQPGVGEAAAGGGGSAGVSGAGGTTGGAGAAGATGGGGRGGAGSAGASTAGGGVGGGGAGVGGEVAPAMPELGQLTTGDDLADQPEVDAGPQAEPETPGGEGVDREAGQIGGAQGVAASPVSGVLDTILDTARSALRGLASRATTAVRDAATLVRTTVSGMIDGAKSLATSAVSTIASTAKTLAGGIVSGIRSAAEAVRRGARSVVSGALGRLQGILGTLGGPIRAAISSALAGGAGLVPAIAGAIGRALGAALAALPGRVTKYADDLVRAVTEGSERIGAVVERVHGWITDKVTLVSDALGRAVTWASGHVNRLLGQVSTWLSGLPAVVRTAVSWLVDRIIALARRVIAALERAARFWIQRATRAILRILDLVRGVVERALDRITRWIVGRIRAIQRKVLRVLSAVQRFRAWLVKAIRSRIERIIAAISARVNRAIVDLVVKLIGPQLRAAVEQVRLAFPNGMPAPAEVVDAARNAGNQVSSRDERGILDGLLRPEGDHIGMSISASGSLGQALGVGGAVGVSLDAVFDYRRHEVGFFITPQVSGQVNVGEVGAKGYLNVGRSWGTVGSFGDPNADVLQSWGGWSTGVTYGAQASIAEGFGGGIQSGGTIYRGGSVNLAPGSGFSYTPLGAGTRTEPGQPIPTQFQPGTPGTQDAFHMGEVRFPTGVGDVGGAQPAAGPTLDEAARVARDYPNAHTGAQVTRVTVTGEASPPWRHPRAGLTPDQENDGLSRQRAETVAGALGPRLPGTPVAPIGIGSRGATGSGLTRDDPAPERQRALITGEASLPGTPGTTTGGGTTPPQEVPNSFQVDPSIPNPFTSEKAAWGWDTTIGVGGGGGANAQAGVYGGITTGFAFPIGKASFDPFTMKLIRIAVGLYKLFNDVITGSPLGFIRDAVALGVWGIEELVGESIATAVLDWVIPLPSEASTG